MLWHIINRKINNFQRLSARIKITLSLSPTMKMTMIKVTTKRSTSQIPLLKAFKNSPDVNPSSPDSVLAETTRNVASKTPIRNIAAPQSTSWRMFKRKPQRNSQNLIIKSPLAAIKSWTNNNQLQECPVSVISASLKPKELLHPWNTKRKSNNLRKS